jgi:hypothetical protein
MYIVGVGPFCLFSSFSFFLVCATDTYTQEKKRREKTRCDDEPDQISADAALPLSSTQPLTTRRLTPDRRTPKRVAPADEMCGADRWRERESTYVHRWIKQNSCICLSPCKNQRQTQIDGTMKETNKEKKESKETTLS